MNAKTRLKRRPVRIERERVGLTREQLAVKAGVGTSTLYLAERVGLISPTTATKLATVLGVQPEKLLSRVHPAATICTRRRCDGEPLPEAHEVDGDER